MAQDIINIVTGETMSDVPSILWPKAGGGQARFIDAEAWSWLGIEPKLIATPIAFKATLDDTDFDSWTASTSAHTLIDTTSPATFRASMADHSYLVKWRWQIDVHWVEGVTKKAIPQYQCGEIYQILCRRPNSVATIISESFVGNAVVSTRSPAIIIYYNTSGTRTYAYSASYGFYMAAVAPTFSNSTSNTPTVTLKTPTCSCRCNSSYFATGRKGEIDLGTTIEYICELYELPLECMETQVHHSLVDLYNNPLVIPDTED